MIRVLSLVIVVASVASASSSVKGTVVDEAGNLVFPAKVLLLNPVDQKVLYETTVVRGAFRIEPVAPQSYFVSIQATAFREYAASVSVAQDQAIDMGRITMDLALTISSRWGDKRWDVVGRPPSLPEPDYVDAHIRTLSGSPMMTVCEYLNLRSKVPLCYESVIVIGILERTVQGSYLRQSCSDSLRSGDYSWPNAIALEDKAFDRAFDTPGRWDWAYAERQLNRPGNEGLDPKDREGRWVAVFGRLETREKLIAVPCGSGQHCAYGFGAISAPARMLYQSWHDFGGMK